MSGEQALSLSGVRKRFSDGGENIVALDGVTLDAAPGDFISVLGPSGSGKTTLLGVMGCLLAPDEGDFFFEGCRASDLSERERARLRAERVGFVFQDNRLAEHLRVWENAALPLVLSGRCGSARVKAIAALESVGMAYRAGSWPRRLSFGQRKRVGIARALAAAPPLLLADEPTGGLDSAAGDAVMDLFARLNREHGTTIVVATHNESHARRAARVFELRDGRLRQLA